MKVLRVITSMNPKNGGPCQGIRNSIPFIKNLGVESEVVCLDNQNIEYNTNDDFVIHKIGRGKSSYQYQPLLLKWLKENLKNYEVVIVHGLWQYHNIAVYNAIKSLKKQSIKVPKVMIMPHGMLDPYFQKAPERKWKALRNEIIWRYIEKKCINNADALFFTCEEEMRLAANTFKGYHPKKTINIGYGIQNPPTCSIELKQAFEQKCPAIQGKKYWLFLSRIHEKKGVNLLIQAYNKLVEDISSLPDLVIAGPTDSDYAQELIAMAAPNSKIHFPGMLQGEEKWGAFYGCEVYLLPSHQENFGIAVAEAMACYKPVLITNKVNIYREIEEGGGGIISEDTLAGTIENLKKWINLSKEAQEKMGQNAFLVYQKHFNVKNATNRLLDAIKQ